MLAKYSTFFLLLRQIIPTMANIDFLIRSKKKGNLATLTMRLHKGRNIDIKVASEFVIMPEMWSNKNQGFNRSIAHTEFFSKNDQHRVEEQLANLRNLVMKEFNKASIEDVAINKQWLSAIVKDFHHPHRSSGQTITLNDFIAGFISQIESGERLTENQRRYNIGTTKNYKGFQSLFNLFQKKKNRSYNFGDINMDFYKDFVSFCNKKDYSPNTIGRHIKNLKTLMRIAREEGYHNNSEIDRKKFKILREDVDNVYLTEKEVKALFDLDLSNKYVLDVTRDVFLAGCYTAQRYSDYSRIRKDHVKEKEGGRFVIDLTQMKTGERVIIPIRSELLKILEKYDFNLPKTFEQKINKNIKEVCKLANIIEPQVINEVRGGVMGEKVLPKCDLVKTHTARRTGCTNMYLARIPVIDIMKVSGHKTPKEFLKYIKVSKDETAESLGEHPYFK
jgi:integrase